MKWNQMKIQLEHCLKKDFPFLYASLCPRFWMSSRWTWTTWSWMTLTPQMLTLMMTFSMIDWDLPTVCSQALYRAYLKEKERPNPFSPLFFSFVFVRKNVISSYLPTAVFEWQIMISLMFYPQKKGRQTPSFCKPFIVWEFQKNCPLGCILLLFAFCFAFFLLWKWTFIQSNKLVSVHIHIWLKSVLLLIVIAKTNKCSF